MTRTFFRAAWLALALIAFTVPVSPAHAADATPHMKGLWLTTDYPSVTARGGDSTTVKIKLQNYGLAPEKVALSVEGVPAGWKAMILGGGAPVSAAMPATDDNVQLSLRIDTPVGLTSGTQTITLRAKSASASAAIPIDVTIGQALPAVRRH